jgi:FlaA1/EpsC-like NDP-sugar epimerase
MSKNLHDRNKFVRQIFLVLLDILSIGAALMISLLLRFNLTFASVEEQYIDNAIHMLPILVVFTVVLFFILRLYNSLWKFVSTNELEYIVIGCFFSASLCFACFYITPWKLPRSCSIIYFLVLMCLVSASRFGYRALRHFRRRYMQRKSGSNVMIIGAGDAGNMIVREMKASEHLNKSICCIIDDDPAKIGNYIHGVKIVGDTQSVPHFVEKYSISEIIIAIPSASKADTRRVIDICKGMGCALKVLPGISELVSGSDGALEKLRDVNVEDLLGREPVKVDLNSIMGYVTGKVVLVTGGGGSIGSELCRQLADHGVGRLIIVDIYENNAYDIQQELKISHPELDLVVLIASVRNTLRMRKIFEEYRPQIVYHAAAHKHVPLMEDSPDEAIKNNVFGTLKTVMAADACGTERFVLISTDKAVNPTNIMGASKRMCEMIVQTYNKRSKTEFVAVRFGNVLGSNGSVIPLFKRQIAEGGPVTVTHPDIIRYFMTIPEAVSLVLQAGAYAKGGEIFVLDMGEPVKILDLAENMIRLSGFVPYRDIDITFTGLRPGEKLYEEMLMKEEGMQETENRLIHIGKPIEMDDEKFLAQLDQLYKEVLTEPKDIREAVSQIVPTYHYNKGK